MAENSHIADIRREYTLAGLRRADLDADPITQFSKWFDQALAAGVADANVMTLATVDQTGQPSARVVLLKIVDARGFGFFTNYESRKGRELAANPNASLVVYWGALERQVGIAGTVTQIPREESINYFNSRPKGSRLAAWASHQSETITNRAELESRLEQIAALHPGEDVPMPPNWGGYCLKPARIEFWQGRPNRLHDRFQYTRAADESWRLDRLSP